jgi:hypothetical protein
MTANRWAAAMIAVTLAAPRAAAPVAQRPASSPRVEVAPCVTTVDRSDLFAVARAVIARLECGSGPPPAGVLSPHAAHVLPRRAGPFTVVGLAIVDPRSAPVVVAAEIQDRAGRRRHDILLTAFGSPAGGWFIDDLAIVD